MTHASRTATHTHVAVQFNRDNLETFIRLGVADRLTHITYCKPTGALEPVSYGAALVFIHAGKNVYANVTVDGDNCASGEVWL